MICDHLLFKTKSILYRAKRFFFFLLSFFMKKLNIMSNLETIDYIVTHHCSVARLGNGEMDIVLGDNKRFQKYDKKLAEELKSLSTTNNLLLCVPKLLEDKKVLNMHNNNFYKKNRKQTIFYWRKTYNKSPILGDACFTRFYIDFDRHENVESYVELVKQIWCRKDIVVIEGEYTRFGVGNDLLSGATSVSRIICPSENAYDVIDDIELFVRKCIEIDKLLLVALGPTASVLCYRLSLLGYQAIDIGHVDIEYEWYKKGARTKINIDGKYVNEAVGSPIIVYPINDAKYNDEIIKRIGVE